METNLLLLMTLIVTLWAVVEKEGVVDAVARGEVLVSSAASVCSADADGISTGAIGPTLTAGAVLLSLWANTSAAAASESSSINMCNAASCCCSALWPVTCDV